MMISNDTLLSDLPLSARLYNCLRWDYKTAGDVRKKSDSDLLRVYNFGSRCLKELYAVGILIEHHRPLIRGRRQPTGTTVAVVNPAESSPWFDFAF